jgi:hypothetical protein
MTNFTNHNQSNDQQDALAWIAGRLVWDRRLADLRSADNRRVHLGSKRAA